MTDFEIYLGHLGFKAMADELAREIQKTIKKTLEDEKHHPSADPIRTLHANIKTKAKRLAGNPMFKRDSPGDPFEIKNIEYQDTLRDGVLYGTMLISNGYIYDPNQYGTPGYPGEYDGQLIQDEFCTIYKWHEASNRWYQLKDHPDRIFEKSEEEEEGSWWKSNIPTTGRYNTDRGGATIWGSSTTASGFGIEPWDSNPADHDKWGDPDIAPRGAENGGINGNGGLLAFNLVVHLAKLFVKTDDAGKKVVDTYGSDKNTGVSSEETSKAKVEDTITQHIDLFKIREVFPHDTIAKVSKDVKGYQNALKYGNYHTNMETQGFNWYIEITPKYEE